jgi:two-component system, chemotaxis family, protein-glutamate methylesterase/glutaminase
VAPPDRHLLIQDHKIRLTRGPRENTARPAIDPLFRKAALQYGPRVVGVILTGMLDDGTGGLSAVKACGGKAVVQDPSIAAWPSMPRSALENVGVDYCLPLAQIAPVLIELVHQRPGKKVECLPSDDVQFEVAREKSSEAMRKILERTARPSQLACPECSGPLWELKSEGPAQFRCEVGHGYSAESFREAQLERVERATLRGKRIRTEEGREREAWALALRVAPAGIRAGTDPSAPASPRPGGAAAGALRARGEANRRSPGAGACRGRTTRT